MKKFWIIILIGALLIIAHCQRSVRPLLLNKRPAIAESESLIKKSEPTKLIMAETDSNAPLENSIQEQESEVDLDNLAENFCSSERITKPLNPLELRYCVPKSVTVCELCAENLNNDTCSWNHYQFKNLFNGVVGVDNDFSSSETYSILAFMFKKSGKMDMLSNLEKIYKGVLTNAQKQIDLHPFEGYCIARPENCTSEETSRTLTGDEMMAVRKKDGELDYTRGDNRENCIEGFKYLASTPMVRLPSEYFKLADVTFDNIMYRGYTTVVFTMNSVYDRTPRIRYLLFDEEGDLSAPEPISDSMNLEDQNKFIKKDIDSRIEHKRIRDLEDKAENSEQSSN